MINNLGQLQRYMTGWEQKLPLAQMRAFGFNYWPLLRFALNYRRKYGKGQTDLPEVDENILMQRVAAACEPNAQDQRERSQAARSARMMAEVKRIETLPKADILLFLRQPDHTFEANNKYCAPLIDALADHGLNGESYVKIIPERTPETEYQYLIEPHFIPLTPFVAVDQNDCPLHPANMSMYEIAAGIMGHVRQFNQLIAMAAPQYRLSFAEILYRIGTTHSSIKYADAILDVVQPKLIFVTSYTGRSFLVAAARKRGIQVVDIQHGGAHQNNIAMANWHQVPQDGYELIPDIFWCWTQRAADYVTFDPPTHHRALVGGNPGHGLFEAAHSPTHGLFDAGTMQSFDDLKTALNKNTKPKILVALQYGQNELLSEHVISAYRSSCDQVEWIFRLHPMGRDRLSELSQHTDIAKTQVDAASQIPLSMLLPHVDMVLTKSSTIVQEAVEAGILGVVWSTKGATNFADLIDQGTVKPALTLDDLTALISELISGDVQKPNHMTIEHGELTRQTVRQLINSVADH